MASNIGCSSGRAKLVDPNNFSGLGSSDNIFVPLEDLNISVILKSFRKGRTLLTAESDGTGSSDNVAQIEVNFIEGSNIGGKKVLTTKYTDLTTSFDKDTVNDETLGITGIDIEFNASMAPMVTIQFVDVRGSSIFQNEENILGNKGNKYTTFFQLPYPMFELEIKGYYGYPVKYCLHMYKFNSKFNSKTGNFEITANFIGFTFALMSDMLLGYLRAIPYTKIGAERLTAYRTDTGRNVLTLDELADKIQKINDGLSKEAGESQEGIDYSASRDALALIESLQNKIKLLGTNLDLNGSKLTYDFIILKHADELTSDQDTALNNTYKENVKGDIEKYNELTPDDKLVESDFVDLSGTTNTNGGKLYKNITKKALSGDSDVDLLVKLGNPTDIETLKKKILEDINKNYKDSNAIADEALLDIYDMSLLNDKLAKLKVSRQRDEETTKKALAEKFALLVREELGFEPTIRPLVECFTASIEMFVETIFIVSQAATTNTDRANELAKKFTADDTNVSDIHSDEIKAKQFYPWPDYREKDETKGGAYVEKYLGSAGVLESPEKVDELVFIEELLEAFRKSYKAQQETIEDSQQSETTWVPINPFDSNLFNSTDPYERYEITTLNDAVRIMVIRAMTFFGYSYKPELLSEPEIAALAQIETEAVLRGVKDDSVKQNLTQLTLDAVKKVQGTITGVDRPVVNIANGVASYDYIFAPDGKPIEWKLLPVSGGFNKATWIPKVNELVKMRDNEGYIFFTNYSTNLGENSQSYSKEDDGGTYIKILDKNGLSQAKSLITTPEGVTYDSTLILEKLKQATVDKTAGFSPFGGAYGTQEFSKLDWGDPNLQGLPLAYIFYRDGDDAVALAEARKQNVERSPHSFYRDEYVRQIFGGRKTLYESSDGKNTVFLHDNLGKNRALLNRIVTGGEVNTISYPYIELPWFDTRTSYNGPSFSLFGSSLYYLQQTAKIKLINGDDYDCSEYNKAFLFLHTLPFNINTDTSNPFGQNEILNLFRNSAGIIHAPKLWCAYIGSIFWRNSGAEPIIEDGKIVGGGSGNREPIVMEFKDSNIDIQYGSDLDIDKFFPSIGINDSNDDIPNDSLLHRLPHQLKDEFKKVFFNFVNGTEGGITWRQLADKLEIFDGTLTEFQEFLDYAYYYYNSNNSKHLRTSSTTNKEGSEVLYMPKNFSGDLFLFDELYNYNGVLVDNIKKYYNIVTLNSHHDTNQTSSLFLELRDNRADFPNPAVSLLLQAITEENYIINSGYKVWAPVTGSDKREPIVVNSAIFDGYFNKVIELLKTKADEYNPIKQNESIDIKIFGTANTDIIRLQLYKTCKNIYDKWLGGAKSLDKLVFQCGGRSLVDTELAKKYSGKSDAKPRMIDSFRFVARSFRDIGDQLYVNPIPINEKLIGNVNTSSYDMISSLLSANNFTFQPLPNFINYRDDKVLTSIFKPYSYMENELEAGACGPSFVCVYVGQGSQHLDYGRPGNSGNNSSYYPNDGFDLRCKDGGLEIGAPDDVIGGGTSSSSTGPELWEEPVSAFVVKYSQQNQNIFKDIDLDQSEFTETDESLQIQDEISQKGSGNNRAIAGQNIYNVYAVRSYTAKVEMMGNAMIQPMMFFQLDNIPMFHGAYLITKVTHSIKPNTMSTNFQGTRIRYPETPLVTAYDVYMDILENLELGSGGGTAGGSGSGNYIEHYNKILIFNKPSSTTIEGSTLPSSDALTKRAEEELKKWGNGSVDEADGIAMLEVYANTTPGPSASEYASGAEHWSGVFISYIMTAGDAKFPKSPMHYNYVTAAMDGKEGYEAFALGSNLKIKVEVGDLFCTKRPGKYTSSHCDVVYKVSGNVAYLVGGNLSDSVKEVKINTSSGYVVQSSDVDTYQVLVKKTGNKYYNNKKLSTASAGVPGKTVGCPAVDPTKPFKTKQVGVKSTILKLLNGTYDCPSNRDCKGALEGLKQIPAFWSNNKLTMKGVIAITQGINEGFGSSPQRKNPGNVKKSGSGFDRYSTWKEGWQNYLDYKLIKWSQGDPPATASRNYVDCYKTETNNLFKASNVKYNELGTYNYVVGDKPTLRQYINLYAPWGDGNNPSNYIASVALTLGEYGYNINVDDTIYSWLK